MCNGEQDGVSAADIELLSECRLLSEFSLSSPPAARLVHIVNEQAADPNCRTTHGATPLHLLASKGSQITDDNVRPDLPVVVAIEVCLKETSHVHLIRID